MEVLSHVITDDASAGAGFRVFMEKAWRAFFANSGHRNARGVGNHRRINLLNRTVTPLLRFWCPAWSCCQSLAKRLDAMQRRMIATIQRVPRVPCESDHSYFSRRSRLTTSTCQRMGLWSRLHGSCVISWSDHVKRHPSESHWPAVLLDYRPPSWFADRRLALGSSSSQGGRTGTRATAGGVARRWADGVQYAREALC